MTNLLHTANSNGVQEAVILETEPQVLTNKIIRESVAAVAGSTGTGTALPNSGISTIGSTAAAVNYVLANPAAAGDKKMIICTAGSTANTSTVTTGSTACTFDGSHRTATFNAAGDSLELIALSTTRWFININNGSVALS